MDVGSAVRFKAPVGEDRVMVVEWIDGDMVSLICPAKDGSLVRNIVPMGTIYEIKHFVQTINDAGYARVAIFELNTLDGTYRRVAHDPPLPVVQAYNAADAARQQYDLQLDFIAKLQALGADSLGSVSEMKDDQGNTK